MSFYGNFDTSVNNTKGEGKDFFVDGLRISVEGLDFSEDTAGEDS